MKTIKTFTFSILMLMMMSFNERQKETNIDPQNKPTDILKKTAEKLNNLKNVSYSYYRSINYFSEDYHSETRGTTFINFDKSNTSSGFKFQLEDENMKIVYNGIEYFSLDKGDKTISIKKRPRSSSFENISFFLNSLITLKKSLPVIIADREIHKNLSDTIINNKSYYLASFVLKNKTLSGLGNFSPITLKRNFLYKIVIDKSSFLPLQIIQTNDAEPKDYMLTSFDNIQTKDNIPSELSWYYSTYNEYEQKTDKRLTIIKHNEVVPPFNLPYHDNNDTISLAQLQSKFVLIEFWMKNCGYCIRSIPTINSLLSKFDKTTLSVIGINSSDNSKEIAFFYQKNKPLFKTLLDENGKVTRDFGVDAFPQVVLLDGNRNVIYSGSLNIEEIEKLLSTK
jgi:peroxiredoxin